MDYEKKLSTAAQTIKPSGIRKFFDLANQMEGVISLGVGEPDFATPWKIREAAIYSIEKGRTFYTANRGLLELRQEISNYYYRQLTFEYAYFSDFFCHPNHPMQNALNLILVISLR